MGKGGGIPGREAQPQEAKSGTRRRPGRAGVLEPTHAFAEEIFGKCFPFPTAPGFNNNGFPRSPFQRLSLLRAKSNGVY